ncbi:hypothetical protein K432DRAFT_341819 [Lepidopterella palustris CBS 459.81]|uniref:HAUS augmin-like complex subunit 1 n=1 Tax=Lepidopterella palustris CBS 459.81 TaxID=1314670 RepID=A0A8E2EMG3_9PEZI|nr:hypothetical protein K432DRAFT_341819 [Lepidopterella palustris CBS 459.81]
MDTSLTPTDLFSPSKARQQRAQAQDWAQIESWLRYKYAGRSIPTFERNEETLKALRALALANERADEERSLIERVEQDALKELQETDINPADAKILNTITSNLTPEGQRSLDALASTAIALETPNTDPETLAHTLIQHTTTASTLSNQLNHLQTLQSYLNTQLSSLRSDLQSLQSPAFTTPSSLPRQTTDWSRQTRLLRSKMREYEDKLATLPPPTPSSSITSIKPSDLASAAGLASLVEKERELVVLRERVEKLEEEVAQFRHLPTDKEAARKEVRKREVELDGLRRARDGLFEGLMEK